MSHLTQKERYLLEDQKVQEELCIKKYNNYAQQAKDPQLKQLCQQLAQHEKQHLDTINQILSGQVPNGTARTAATRWTRYGDASYAIRADRDDQSTGY